MKKTLLIVFSTYTVFTFSQNQITNYFGNLTTTNSSKSYTIVSSSNALTFASGSNINWNYNTLVPIGTATYLNTAPTAAQILSYPNTTMVTKRTAVIGTTTKITDTYSSTLGNNYLITGIWNGTGNNFSFNYTTNNCKVGNFPFTYLSTDFDNFVGYFFYDVYNDYCAGSITSNVDAYGTLQTNLYSIPQNVTRLKTVQTTNIASGSFLNAGQIVETIYGYYKQNEQFPFLKSVTTVVNSSIPSVNTSTTIIEISNDYLLTNLDFIKQNKIQILTNPVDEYLTLINLENENLKSLKIMDINGRLVKSINNNFSLINVSELHKGIYFVEIETEAYKITKKIVKR